MASSKTRIQYYLVSYSHSRGFGTIYVHSEPHISIPQLEEDLKLLLKEKVVIITINKLNKAQYEEGTNDRA